MVQVTYAPEQVEFDVEFGRSLGCGPRGVVFKDSPVTSAKFRSDPEPKLDVANEVRYRLYLQRLSASGADPLDLRERTVRGIRR